MKVIKSVFNDVHLLEPDILSDNRGFFYESYNATAFNTLVGYDVNFVQDNQSFSKKSILRGLHYQIEPHQQDKLVRVVDGEIYDVVVDIRRDSETFGSWHGEFISSKNHRQLWIPKGFAHGFIVTSDKANVIYKTTEHYFPDSERTIKFDDPDLNIIWPIPVMDTSEKDSQGSCIKDLF